REQLSHKYLRTGLRRRSLSCDAHSLPWRARDKTAPHRAWARRMGIARRALACRRRYADIRQRRGGSLERHAPRCLRSAADDSVYGDVSVASAARLDARMPSISQILAGRLALTRLHEAIHL